jgi:hypothetical protein
VGVFVNEAGGDGGTVAAAELFFLGGLLGTCWDGIVGEDPFMPIGPNAAPTAPATAFLPLATISLNIEGFLCIVKGERRTNSSPSSPSMTVVAFPEV